MKSCVGLLVSRERERERERGGQTCKDQKCICTCMRPSRATYVQEGELDALTTNFGKPSKILYFEGLGNAVQDWSFGLEAVDFVHKPGECASPARNGHRSRLWMLGRGVCVDWARLLIVVIAIVVVVDVVAVFSLVCRPGFNSMAAISVRTFPNGALSLHSLQPFGVFSSLQFYISPLETNETAASPSAGTGTGPGPGLNVSSLNVLFTSVSNPSVQVFQGSLIDFMTPAQRLTLDEGDILRDWLQVRRQEGRRGRSVAMHIGQRNGAFAATAVVVALMFWKQEESAIAIILICSSGSSTHIYTHTHSIDRRSISAPYSPVLSTRLPSGLHRHRRAGRRRRPHRRRHFPMGSYHAPVGRARRVSSGQCLPLQPDRAVHDSRANPGSSPRAIEPGKTGAMFGSRGVETRLAALQCPGAESVLCLFLFSPAFFFLVLALVCSRPLRHRHRLHLNLHHHLHHSHQCPRLPTKAQTQVRASLPLSSSSLFALVCVAVLSTTRAKHHRPTLNSARPRPS